MAAHTESLTSTPSRLETPTDLCGEEVQAVCDAVNPLIADALALYVKTKNFHWHVSGSHFRDFTSRLSPFWSRSISWQAVQDYILSQLCPT